MANTFLELLSPARDLETGIAAIDHGADAVYIGAGKFGARKQAGNSVQDIEKLAKYAHLFQAKVFVAFNTILYDNELDAAQQLIHELYHCGADALIVQDMGILEMDLPPLPLHASTQAHNFGLQRIQFLEKANFQRLVLARELSLNEIQEIRTHTTAELEYFIHGALCVSLSGQCYLSHAQGGRSANRGECAQACRLPYTLRNTEGEKIMADKHLLSLKDLNHSDKIEALAKAGIQSFKIEGRLKSTDYVKNTVAFYRKKLDQLIEKGIGTKASSGKVETNFVPDPERSFNRSSSNYFLDGKAKKLANFESPKSTGKPLGIVKKLFKDGFELAGSEPLNNGDGLCFFTSNGKLEGLRVNKAEGKRIFADTPKSLQQGIQMFRNHDQAFSKLLEKSSNCRHIAVDVLFSETNEGFLLQLTDEDGIQNIFGWKTEKEPAKNAERALENLKKQLSKTGDTAFAVTEVTFDLSQAYFFPASQVNQIRREAFDLLQKKRETEYKRVEIPFQKTDHPYPHAKLDYKANIANRLAKQFYERHGVTETERAFELLTNRPNAELMTTRYCVKYEMGICPVHQKKSDKTETGSLFIENQKGKFRLDFDCKACMMHIRKV